MEEKKTSSVIRISAALNDLLVWLKQSGVISFTFVGGYSCNGIMLRKDLFLEEFTDYEIRQFGDSREAFAEYEGVQFFCLIDEEQFDDKKDGE